MKLPKIKFVNEGKIPALDFSFDFPLLLHGQNLLRLIPLCLLEGAEGGIGTPFGKDSLGDLLL